MNALHTLLVGLTLTVATAAQAHDDQWLDQQVAPNGGQLRMAGIYHLELVVKNSALELHVSDHANTPQAADGSSAQITLIASKKVTKATLNPTGKSVLSATGTFATTEDLQAIVVFTPKGQKPLTAKFMPFKKAAASDHHEHDHSHDKPEHSHKHQEAHDHGDKNQERKKMDKHAHDHEHGNSHEH